MPRNCWTRCNKTFPCSFPAREKTREIESREISRRLEKQEISALLRKMIYKPPFATVGQLLVCPPSTAPFAARTAFGVCPFPRPCPARHLVPVTLGETRLYLWLLLIVWHFSWFVKKFFSSFSTNPVILLGLFAQNTLQIPKKGQTNAPGYATLRQTT